MEARAVRRAVTPHSPRRFDGIVLDLDDTLFDTTRILLPAADRRAVRAMRAVGLSVEEADALPRIRALRAAGVTDVFAALAREHGAPAECGPAGERAFFAYEHDVPPIALDPRTCAALDELAAIAPLALLTSGHPPTQRAKVERLGLGTRWFAHAMFLDHRAHPDKTEALRLLLDTERWTPSHVVVCGDRPDSDVRAGNRNGCLTVLVRRDGAEFASVAPRSPQDVPWRVVAHVAEVAALLRA